MIALNKAFNCTELVIDLDKYQTWEDVLKKVEQDFSNIVENKKFFLNSSIVLKSNKQFSLDLDLEQKIKQLRSLEEKYKLKIEFIQSDHSESLSYFKSAGFKVKPISINRNHRNFEDKVSLNRDLKVENLLSLLPQNSMEIKTAFIGLSSDFREGVVLRSGSVVSYEGNVVVLGDVNSASQIKASGSIFILGKIRGTLHAGFKETDPQVLSQVRVCFFDFESSSQIAIGSVFSCLEQASVDKTKNIQIARLLNNEICLL